MYLEHRIEERLLVRVVLIQRSYGNSRSLRNPRRCQSIQYIQERETNMQTSSGIQGKVVAITGASSGIGEATALLLAERGAKVVLGARGSDRLKALAARIADAGGEASHAPTDVRRRDDVSALVKLACERYG